jgi:hypothetical protein
MLSLLRDFNDVPGGDVWTKGVTTSVDPGAQALLTTAVGSGLYSAAVGALNKYWVLKPQGSESATALRNRIAMVFAQNVAASWSGVINIDAVENSQAFQSIVADVSITSRLKTPEELGADRTKMWLLIGGGVLVLGILGLLLFKKKSTATPVAPAASAGLPDATIS